MRGASDGKDRLRPLFGTFNHRKAHKNNISIVLLLERKEIKRAVLLLFIGFYKIALPPDDKSEGKERNRLEKDGNFE